MNKVEIIRITKIKMKIKVPLGSEIDQKDSEDKRTVKIRVPNTKFWVLGEKIEKNLWNTYLTEPRTTYKELIKRNYTTKAFAIFSGLVLETPFPYEGKRAENSTIIKKFLKKTIKTYEQSRIKSS